MQAERVVVAYPYGEMYQVIQAGFAQMLPVEQYPVSVVDHNRYLQEIDCCYWWICLVLFYH